MGMTFNGTSLTGVNFNGTDLTKVTFNGTVVFTKSVTNPCLCFTANTAGSTISMSVTGTPTLSLNFQTSINNGVTWQTFIPGTTTITLTNVGDKVYFKGNNPNGVSQTSSIYYQFIMTGSVDGSGNIMSLIDNGLCSTVIIPNNYCFVYMFKNCTSITVAPELPATTLTNFCYYLMFNGCTSLTTISELPINTVGGSSCRYMFAGCTRLTTIPSLPATTLLTNCYRLMFNGCSLIKLSTTLTGEYTNAYRIPMSGTGSVETYSITDMFTGTGGTFKGTPSINTTYYTSNTIV